METATVSLTEPLRKREAVMPVASAANALSASVSTEAEPAAKKGPGVLALLPFDPLRVVDAVYRKLWLALGVGAAFGTALYIAAMIKVEPHYVGQITLLRQDPPTGLRASDSGEAFKPAQISIATLTGLMKLPSVNEAASAAIGGKLSPAEIAASVKVATERGTDIIRVSMDTARGAEVTATALNAYAAEVVNMTRTMMVNDATAVDGFLRVQLIQVEAEMAKTDQDLLRYSRENNIIDTDKEIDSALGELADHDTRYEETRLDYETLDLRIASTQKELAKASPLAAKLSSAKEEEQRLLARYTSAYPLVQEQAQRVKTLEAQLHETHGKSEDRPPQSGESVVAESLYLNLVDLRAQKEVLEQRLNKMRATRDALSAKLKELPRKSLEVSQIKMKRQSLEKAQAVLASRQREAQLYAQNSLAYYRVHSPVKPKDIGTDTRSSKRVMAAAGGMACGTGLVLLPFIGLSLLDGRLRTAGDLHRATKLPVLLSTLPGEVHDEAWALREWSRIKPKLSCASGSVVCGFLAKDGREGTLRMVQDFARAADRLSSAVIVISSEVPDEEVPAMPLADAMQPALIRSADDWLRQENGLRFLHIDERWTWLPAQRRALAHAVKSWSHCGNAVVLIELPDAAQPEAMLMASSLPRVLWVAAGDAAQVSDVADCIATCRHAGCQVQGALMHHPVPLKPAVLNRVAQMIAACVLLFVMPVFAEADAEAIAQHGAERVALAKQRMAARLTKDETDERRRARQSTEASAPPRSGERAYVAQGTPSTDFRLGPGDGISIGMFGMPELVRPEVTLAPDGTITYLQVQKLKASGLTIDELRDALGTALQEHYQTPRVIITPVAFKSRRVYILGKVVKKGVVMMDRPLSLLEAVTEAGGLETGIFQQNTVELADLGRSFLVRGGQRVPVNFESLFFRGDMSQNVPLESEDYLYFPSANNNDIYVIGSVAHQGTQGLLAHSTVVSAVALAGGFSKRAYRSRVLVVRGSLDKPQAFAVDVDDILKGTGLNFRLEPKDIIYVADHPWSGVQELLEKAVGSFIQAAMLTAAGTALPPLISAPLITTPNYSKP